MADRAGENAFRNGNARTANRVFLRDKRRGEENNRTAVGTR
jgi:hypothetical protein